jgi:iron only hydrogenase large subunit-like protein
MACPGGCVNGGGQIRPQQEAPSAVRERIARVGAAMKVRRLLALYYALHFYYCMLHAGFIRKCLHMTC